MNRKVNLLYIENDFEITQGSTPVFWKTLIQALLLALKDDGGLSEPQYSRAVERLNGQYRSNSPEIRGRGDSDV